MNRHLITWSGVEWQTESTKSIKSELNRIIAKDRQRNPLIADIQIHDNFVKNFCFLMKILQMNFFGHCIFVGSDLEHLEDVSILAAHLYEFQFEKLPIEISEFYWKETLIKVARQCCVENRKILLFINDQIFSSKVFKQILSDISIMMNSGMIPATAFSPQLLSELKSNSFTDGKKDFTEWRQKEAITKAIRQNLHVIFRVEKVTVEKYERQFQQISNYSLASFMEWTEAELLNFAELLLQKSMLFGGEEVSFFSLIETNLIDYMCLSSGDNKLFFLLRDFNSKFQIPKFAKKLFNLFKFVQKQLPDLQTLSFLDLVKQYIHIVKEKKSSIELLEKRYKTGISKLEKANEQVNFLQQELLRLQPELVRTSLETT